MRSSTTFDNISNWKNNDGWLTAPVADWYGVTVSGDRVVELSLENDIYRPFGLKGSLPAELGQLSSLRVLDLYNNELTGEIPTELGKLSNLRVLDFFSNELMGQIPAELGQIQSLQLINLSDNRLAGQVPVELSQLSNLQDLHLYNNNLSGRIPVELGKLSSLQSLDFGSNKITEIPAELGQLSSLQTLSLGYNELTGMIPAELSQLSSLQSLYLYNNELSGRIPLSFTNLTALIRFKFDGTNLCEPPGEDFQAWLASVDDFESTGLDDVESTGVTCQGNGTNDGTFSVQLSANRITPLTVPPHADDASLRSVLSPIQFPQNKLAVRVRVALGEDETGAAEDVNVEATLDGTPMNIVLNAKVDTDGDDRIDALPLSVDDAELRYADVLAVSQDALPNGFEGPLTVTASTSSREATASETVSLHYAEHPEQNRPFSATRDAYRFDNFSKLSFADVKEVFASEALAGNVGLSLLFRSMVTWSGRCFGMAGTEGLYFLDPSEKPLDPETYEVYSYDKGVSAVRERITEFHLKQTYAGFSSRLDAPEPANEYARLKSEFEEQNPPMLGMEATGGGRHAVLATKLTVLGKAAKAYAEIADSNVPGVTLDATYDRDAKTFRYDDPFGNEFRRFVSIAVPEVPRSLGEAIADYLKNAVGVLDGRKLFSAAIDATIGQAAAKQAQINSSGGVVNLLVENEQDQRAGHLPGGAPINEIPGAEVERVAAADTSVADSLTFVYVPSGSEYRISMQSSRAGTIRFEQYAPAEAQDTVYTSLADSVTFSASTVATYDEADDANVLHVDHDGDGTTDETINMAGTSVGVGEGETPLPARVALKKNYPNPVRQHTTISYELPEAQRVQLAVYDLLGRQVATLVNRQQSAGQHETRFDAGALPAGVYVYRLKTGGHTATRRMVVVR